MKKAGTRSERTVELLDLYPTLTGLAGLPHYDRNEGQSLEPLLANPNDPKWTKPALSQVRGGRSVRTERWRYTEWEEGGLGRELYDHQSDPGEHHNLAQDQAYAPTVAELKAMLPKGPVEKRAKPVAYDPIRNCLLRPLGGGTANDARKNAQPGKAKSGGEGGGAARICEAIDP
jgi:iduronate 2-sulfatase